MEWNAQQNAALTAVNDWLRSGSKPFFYLGGYAGSGKTTLAKHFAEGVEGGVCFAAYTGKAAHIMRRKGCPATTIHSLLYKPKEKDDKNIKDLLEELEGRRKTDPDFIGSYEENQLLLQIKLENKALQKPEFSINLESSPIDNAGLIIIDECSMIDRFLAEDLLSFRVPILALGDPAQLPPIRGAGYFTGGLPDFMLTTVMRQAEGNPILHLATLAREGQELPPGRYGESEVLPSPSYDFARLLPGVQLIVGKNLTRQKANAYMRRKVGHAGAIPVPGDRLVCLRNDHEMGLTNGGIWSTVSSSPPEHGRVALEIEPEDAPEDGSGRIVVEAHEAIFLGQDLEYYRRRDAQEFDYGYALTAHKAQGSEWPEVLIRDESVCFREDRWRWLYTAITRASERVTILL